MRADDWLGEGSTRWLSVAALGIVLVLFLAACQTNDDEAAPTATVGDTAAAHTNTYALDLIADGLDEPVAIAAVPGDAARLLVLEQGGIVRLLVDGMLQAEPYLDLSEMVQSSGNEQGLLGIAPAPDFSSSGRLYLYYTAQPDGANTLVRLTVDPAAETVDMSSLEVLFAQPDDASNHNGGMLAFDPDGYLFVAMGDGGGGGAPNGQRLDTLLGKLLRLDVSPDSGYAIPPDNPLVGNPDARGEIWAWGLRNPWRFSIDTPTRTVLIGDVGATTQEEINAVPLDTADGYNFGWNVMEGDICRAEDAAACDVFSAPVHTYGRDGGCAITGGVIYRGASLPDLDGHYLFSDFCESELRLLRRDSSSESGWADTHEVLFSTDLAIASFGVDAAGEVLVLDRRAGAVYRLVRAAS